MIPMVDLKVQFEEIRDEVRALADEVFSSTRYVLGPHVTELEEKVSAYTGTAHAVGVASGTDALYLSLLALGIGKDDEVITTPFTFFATVEAILYCQARPVFVDIEPGSFNLNAALLRKAVTKRTKAIVPVHLYGNPCDMEETMAVAREYGLAVVEDAAQAFGAQTGGRRVGSFGSTGCFSFYPSKNLGCYGDGGMVVTSDAGIDASIRSLRNHGSSATYVHERVGVNSRLDEIQAGILLIKLKRIERYNELRRKNAALYREHLRKEIVCPEERPGNTHVYHQFTIRCQHRELIQEKLKQAGISSVIYYPIPIHQQKAVGFLGYKAGDFPEAERAAGEVLSLPMYPELSEEDIRRISGVINDAGCR